MVANSWKEHCSEYSKKHGKSYKESMKDIGCRDEWKNNKVRKDPDVVLEEKRLASQKRRLDKREAKKKVKESLKPVSPKPESPKPEPPKIPDPVPLKKIRVRRPKKALKPNPEEIPGMKPV